jgi:hypothetical protein
MGKGWGAVEEAAAAQGQAGEYLPRFTMSEQNQGPKQIRILEQGQEVHTYPVHDYKIQGQGGVQHRQFTCQDEYNLPCPGCAIGLKKKVRTVLNVIERNRPQVKKGPDGFALRVNGPGSALVFEPEGKDEVVVASVGQPTGNMLREKDAHWKGLMTRDWVIKYSGDKMQAWFMEPADPTNAAGEPASENDKHLFANAKHDLNAVMLTTPDEAAEIVRKYCSSSPQGSGFSGQTGGGGFGGQQQHAVPPQTQFAQQPVAQPQAAPAQGGGFGAVAADAVAATTPDASGGFGG